MPPVNPSVIPMDPYRRRKDAAARCEPLASGRRDPHRGPDRWDNYTGPDHDTADALHLLRELWRNPDVTPEQRAALELAGQALADSRRGRWSA